MASAHRSFLVLTALLTALASSAATAEDRTFHVGLDGTFAPHAMPTMSGGVEGFNVDLANEIGKRLGAKMEITATQFSGLIPGLQAGTFDFLAAPTTITPERAENLLFTEGYLDTDFQLVVKADGPQIDDLSELKGKTIAVNKGSAYDSWARGLEEKIGWKVESYGTNSDAIQAVLTGRAAANVAGNTVSAWAVKKNPALKLSYLHKTGLVWGMPFRKDSVDLRNEVERAIECMKIDGTMKAMSEKWFGVTPEEGSTAITPIKGYGQPGFPGYVEDDHTPACK
ncbi:transporter substrate-binding domain-containing protein [Consotaella salsifontis]|uniref:Amino acid ABC transporter substrate-binding protein, PAAT family n=1 Tax=Consotaella salsifontis TaxID=1365950 RepID=A0A1T4SG02_9HYPH|nr:transporter substrate-binding domain-containing protein [Consotaella salsifontis]SKA27083.1 amino acid ABC transporter substrate-binding protein, PAAT family [Consotaella salsifontis]